MVLAVIPARYASARFPGKPLADLGGKALVQWVYEGAKDSNLFDMVVVGTDDERIHTAVTAFGGKAVMTSPDHPSGTDRVAEVARHYPTARIVVNVQGDEPFVRVGQLRQLLGAFDDGAVDIATLAAPVTDEQALLSPNIVKVVRGTAGRALYFSRHAVPYLRDVPVGRWIDAGAHLQHLGLYAYRAGVLQSLTVLPAGPLEQHESLEQLRWLAAGRRIWVGIAERPNLGIDTPADLEEAQQLLTNLGEWPRL